jgi:hypothetical protein
MNQSPIAYRRRHSIMNEVLDRAQIYERYPSEWVLIGNPKTNEFDSVEHGVVLFHSKDREEIYKKAIELNPGQIAVLFTGKRAEHIAINL